MRDTAKKLDFEKAAEIRDKIKTLRDRMLSVGSLEMTGVGRGHDGKRGKQGKKPKAKRR
jgi:hypothetical protein